MKPAGRYAEAAACGLNRPGECISLLGGAAGCRDDNLELAVQLIWKRALGHRAGGLFSAALMTASGRRIEDAARFKMVECCLVSVRTSDDLTSVFMYAVDLPPSQLRPRCHKLANACPK
jgi:hypothetical protein